VVAEARLAGQGHLGDGWVSSGLKFRSCWDMLTMRG
jgi:hypothetical protein